MPKTKEIIGASLWVSVGLVILFSNQIIEFLSNLGFSNPQANFLLVITVVLIVLKHSQIVEIIMRGKG